MNAPQKVGNAFDTLATVCPLALAFSPSVRVGTQKQFSALTCRITYFLAAASLSTRLFLLLSFFLALRRSSSNAWHSTANAFQRKVFKQIFAQLAGSAQAQAERWSPRGRGRQERQAGGWGRLHVSFFLFFAPAFKQCAARRTVCARLEEASRNSVR